ncbi:MFS transporter [Kibdelosporangium phytohabitans]|uniref:Transporter n=1 Tax=Kibdelosporangium phytohabitans TaxID=860235 RepID=A0A0N9IB59_9PSEU|nr:MFS transporter [Kibdelosporangium phytohabitans]ALG12050.1 transporter [Kibdelosporangium phytohabitans]MBE1463530.1 MFS family permease [Kibdelosporangium phytohabitans]
MTTRPAATTPSLIARGTVLAAAALTIMAAAIIAPSLPEMGKVFAGPGAELMVRLALTVTSLMIAVSAPVSGVVADRVGRRPLLVFSLVLYAICGTAGYFVGDLYLLLVTRALLGIAVGGVMTAVSATITDWFDGPRRAAFLGLQQAFASLGGVVFLPLAGLLATVSWRAPFWIYAVSAVVALFAVLAVQDAPRDKHASAPSQGRTTTGPVLGVYAVALVATLAFYMAPTQLPFLLGGFGAGPVVVGVVIAGSTVTSALGALGFPALRKRLSTTAITTTSVALLGVGWLLVGAAGNVVMVTAGLLVGGFGVGFAVPNLTMSLSELAPPDRRGRVLSGLVTGVFLGQFLSPLAVQPLIAATGVADAFTWTGIAMAAGAAIAAAGTRKRKENR